jgi:hypothetical protein
MKEGIIRTAGNIPTTDRQDDYCGLVAKALQFAFGWRVNDLVLTWI